MLFATVLDTFIIDDLFDAQDDPVDRVDRLALRSDLIFERGALFVPDKVIVPGILIDHIEFSMI